MPLTDSQSHFPSVSVIIPTFSGAQTLESAVDQVLKSDYPAVIEILVIDNGSTLPTREAIFRLPERVRIIRSEKNLGFSGGNNLGLTQAQGEVIVLLNDDTQVRPDWLRHLISPLVNQSHVGLVGSLVLEPSGEQIQSSGSQPITNLLNSHIDKGKPLSDAPQEIMERKYLMGVALAIRRDLLLALGGMAECYFPGYYEDMELCHRIRALGLKILINPASLLIHLEKQSSPDDRTYFRAYHRNRWLFILRNLSFGEILRAFCYETTWAVMITRSRDFRHHKALLLAYLFNLLRLPKTIADRIRLKRENRRIKASLKGFI